VGTAAAIRRTRRGRPVRFEEEYHLAAGQDTTTLTQAITAWPRGPFRLIQPLIARQLQALIAADLGRFKQLAEGIR
jgi:hypothetical protein